MLFRSTAAQTLNILPISYTLFPNQPTAINYANLVYGGGLQGTAGAVVSNSSDGPISLTVSSAAGDVYLSQALGYTRATATNGTVTVVGPGRVTLQNDSALGVGRLVLSSSVPFNVRANLTSTGTATINAGSTLRLAGAAGRLSSGSHSAAIVNSGSLVYASGSNQILSGVISGTGALGLAGDGVVTTGSLTLSGSNAFSGATTLTAGSLEIGRAHV